jgi:hypothetical protein
LKQEVEQQKLEIRPTMDLIAIRSHLLSLFCFLKVEAVLAEVEVIGFL